MALVTQPLRDEHKELIPHVEHIRALADSVGQAPLDALRKDLAGISDFLSQHLIPHAHAEDAALYPVVCRLLGSPEATATMSRDHIEVGRLAGELDALRSQLAGSTLPDLTDAQAKALRRVLYGLYALVKVHFAKEEELYVPLLDKGLTAEEARRMFEAMGHAAGNARRQHTH
jgi:iron-sulfur cluster repair protein YtfE (RIC family)